MVSILLVEDERLELETLRDYIDWRKLGIKKVYTARGGRSALECIVEHEPDIMITDIQMPGMSGVELARIVREEGYKCKIVFLTGYDDFEYIKSAFQVQAEDYILKPFQVAEVEALVFRIMRKLEKEKIADESVRIAAGQILELACMRQDINFEEKARKYFFVEASEKTFGILGVYGGNKEQLRKISQMPEILHIFMIEEVLLTIVSGHLSMYDVADRIIRKTQNHTSVAWVKENVSLLELNNHTNNLLKLQDTMFYKKPGMLFCTDQLEVRENTQMDRQVLYEKRKALRKEILAGNETGAIQHLRSCIDIFSKLGRDGCRKETYGLYININSKLVQEDKYLMDMMDRREKKQELTILDSYFLTDLLERIEEYVKELCDFYIRRQDDQNYYVTNWVKNYVNHNYSGICSVEEMAKGINLSPNYLRNLFKMSTGKTILEYITDYRLEKACELLRDKTVKIKDVSMMIGYENVSYFSQIFVKRYGVTPNEYKKMV